MSRRPTEPVYTRLPTDQTQWIADYAAEHHLTKAKAFALVVQAGIDEIVRTEQERTK